jgi:FAD/FMN-containing dehydrogenase
MVDHGSRRYMKATAVYKMTVPVLQTLLAKLTELTTHVGPESFHTVCIYEHFAMAKILSKDEYATAFNNRGNWTGISLLPAWQSPDHDAFARDWVRGTVDALAEVERADESVTETVVGKRAYYNGSTGDEKVTQVFGENYPRLRKIKRKYDPELLFRKWFPIVPADE